jgi:hypothetical protein
MPQVFGTGAGLTLISLSTGVNSPVQGVIAEKSRVPPANPAEEQAVTET